MADHPVYLITGTSSGGFGHEIALAALASGALVIGTVRSKVKSADAVKSLEAAGAQVLELNVSKGSAAVKAVAKQAEDIHGRVDVLVNNAGYSLLGAVEDFEEDEIHAQLNTNVYGPLFLAQALLPGMRARSIGTIVNISSVVGQTGLPSGGMYSASKFALEGWSEILFQEIEPFGVRVLIVEPGAFRTNFLGVYVPNKIGLSPAYKDTAVDSTLQNFNKMSGKQPGEPVKAAWSIVQVVKDGC